MGPGSPASPSAGMTSEREAGPLPAVGEAAGEAFGYGLPVELFVEVVPLRIERVDRLDLPFPLPAFQALFLRDCLVHGRMFLVIDEAADAMSASETLALPFAMLEDPPGKVVGHPDIQRAMVSAGENVDEVCHPAMVVAGCRNCKR